MIDDYVEITNLIFRYAELLDAGDSAGVGELFKFGSFSSAQLGGPFSGQQEVADHYREKAHLFDDGLPWAKHVTSNLIIEVAEDRETATCRSVFLGLQELPGAKSIFPLAVGRYLDEFKKVDGKWYFARRHLVRDLTGDMSHYQ